MKLKNAEWIPLIGLSVYSLGTLFIFLLSPGFQRVNNPIEFILFIVLANLGIIFGFICGHHLTKRYRTGKQYSSLKFSSNIFLTICALLWIIDTLNSMNLYQVSIFDTTEALSDLGSSYNQKLMNEPDKGGGLISSLLAIVKVFTLFVIPLLFQYYKNYNWKTKAVAIVAIALNIDYFILTGTNKGIGDIALTVIVMFYLLHSQRLIAGLPRVRVGLFAKFLIYIIVPAVFLYYFVHSLSSRNTVQYIHDFYFYPSEWLVEMVGVDAAIGLVMAISYPINGYIGLAYCLDIPFKWTEFRGSSRAFDAFISSKLNIEPIFDSTYLRRSEAINGWSADAFWSTAYPWFAGDLTFVGAIFLVSFFAFLLARTWMQSLCQAGIVNTVLCIQFVIFFAYLVANFQQGNSLPNFIAFVLLIIFYLISGFLPSDSTQR